MRSFPILARLALLLALVVPSLAPAAQRARQAPADWAAVSSLSELPAQIVDELGGVEVIADIGGKFNPTCVMQPGVPDSRLVGAVLRSDAARVTVEYGGIVHYVETLEFRKRAGKWTLASD